MSIEQRLARAQRKMTPGTFGGRSRAATPVKRNPKRVEAAVNPPPLEFFKVYAVGQSIAAGSNAPLVLNPSTTEGTLPATVVDGFFDPGVKLMVELPAGTYTATAEVHFTGTGDRYGMIDAFDDADSYGTGQIHSLGTPIPMDLGEFVFSETGYVIFSLGAGVGATGIAATSASWLRIEAV